MNVLVIEDEELAVRKLTKLLQEVDDSIQIVGTVASVRASVQWLQSNPVPDLILMDIELADGQSFEIFEQTPVESPVIFTTSYDEYALRAFKVNSIDYLLKPIKRQELEASLAKHKKWQSQPGADTPDAAGTGPEGRSDAGRPDGDRPDAGRPNGGRPDVGRIAIDALVQQLRQQIQPADYRKRFLVKHLSQWMPIEVADIAYFYSEEGISLFRTRTNQKFSVDYTLDELESMLDPVQFFRANRQFIVDINSVQQIHPYFNNKLKLVLKPLPEEEVLVSRERATEFKKWMGK